MSKKTYRLLAILIAIVMTVSIVPAASAAEEEITLPNGDFESGDTTGWTLTPASVFKVETDGSNNPTKILDFAWNGSEAAEISAAYSVSLAAGSYRFTFQMDGESGTDSGLSYAARSGETLLKKSDSNVIAAGWDNWTTFELAFELEEAAEVTFSVEGAKAIGWWGNLDNLRLFKTVSGGEATGKTITLPNGDFESGTSNWTFTGLTGEVIDNSSSANHTTHVLNLWASNDEEVAISVSYAVKLTEGKYHFEFDVDGADADSRLTYAVKAGETPLYTSEASIVTTGWDKWATLQTGEFELSEPTEVTFAISGTGPVGYWGHLDNLVLIGTGKIYTEIVLDHTPTLAVEKVSGVDGDDFFRGADVSSYLSLKNSGAKFYDYEGEELDDQGFFDLIADAGFNYIRLRVWNDPYDAEGHGYGGGNNDVAAALVMGKLATEAGMKVLIDFHYSDFWADPGKQQTPKAWASLGIDEKAAAVESFTYESLKTLIDGGVDVGMVQVGNETTGAICGESSWENMAKIYKAGSKGVRDAAAYAEKTILVAVHYTNPEKTGRLAGLAKNLNDNGVDYDVFSTSWYPYWHGTTENLTSVLKNVADTYNKKVMVAETSWAWTLDDGDGWDNTVSHTGNNTDNNYPFSVQGQADELVSVAKAVKAVGEAGAGVFYWENAWIPVEYAYNEDGTLNETILASNKAKWEEFGSGWAASYGGGYQADAAEWYGGSAVDNQAMFDFHGKALDSLYTWKYMMVGTEDLVEKKVESVDKTEISVETGETLAMPETVKVTYNVGGFKNEPVVWNAEELAAVDTATPGEYTVSGKVTLSYELGEADAEAKITVLSPNLILNPSFENSDMSMYTVSNGARTGDDPHSGSYSLHFYNANEFTLSLMQTVTLEPGDYTFSLFTQGDSKGSSDLKIYVDAGSTTKTQTFALAGWAVWQNPEIEFTITEETAVTVGLRAVIGAGGWGTVDDLALRLIPAEPDPCAEGHDWTEPEYVWNDDHTECTATRTCSRDETHIETETVEAVKETVREATVEAEGEIRYTAEFENEAFETQTYTQTVSKIDNPDEPTPPAPPTPTEPTEPEEPESPFEDVAKDSDYYDAVMWAVNADPQVTNGTSKTTFSPEKECTRAQVMTFLWRAEGCPEPESTENPFTDVKKTAYYYKAVLWAVEKGITTGTTKTTFSPGEGCKRAQIITFIWRCAGKAEPSVSENPFTDVTNEKAYYYKAALWAYENKLVDGAEFSPDAPCTRGETVSFLYKTEAK